MYYTCISIFFYSLFVLRYAKYYSFFENYLNVKVFDIPKILPYICSVMQNFNFFLNYVGVGSLGTGPGVISTDTFPAYSSNMGRPTRGGIGGSGKL